jgi:hypothetical protein
MANDDRDYREADKIARTARNMAIAALVVAVIALIWAIKADNKAGDALNQTQQHNTSATLPEGA